MAVFKLHTFTHFICFAPSCTLFLPRLLTESKQAEFTQKARILIQLEKYEDAVSIGGGGLWLLNLIILLQYVQSQFLDLF